MPDAVLIDDVSRNGEDPFAKLQGMLSAFNEAHAGPSQWSPVWLFARDKQGQLKGGLRGSTSWSWLYVETLAVAEPYRRQGIGAALLVRAEAVALARGCIGIYLWTTSFQAPDFYKRFGFQQFGHLPDLPPGHSGHWLMKRLNNAIDDPRPATTNARGVSQ
jgi:GNAT superfamily N-acetyltransferase